MQIDAAFARIHPAETDVLKYLNEQGASTAAADAYAAAIANLTATMGSLKADVQCDTINTAYRAALEASCDKGTTDFYIGFFMKAVVFVSLPFALALCLCIFQQPVVVEVFMDERQPLLQVRDTTNAGYNQKRRSRSPGASVCRCVGLCPLLCLDLACVPFFSPSSTNTTPSTRGLGLALITPAASGPASDCHGWRASSTHSKSLLLCPAFACCR